MAIATPREIGVAVCDALGLDPANVESVTIKLTATDAARVEVVRFVTDDDGKKLNAVLKRYTLTESDDGNTANR